MINSLTSLRWFCALYVFIFHVEIRMPVVPHPFQSIAINGYTGMAFFFILSGFVLTVRYWDTKINYAEFFVFRFARVYPAFITAYILSIPLFIHNSAANVILNALMNVTLTQAWFPNLFPIGLNGGTWSLSVEIFFYLLFPTLIPLFRSWAGKETGYICVLPVVVLWFLSFLPGLVQDVIPTNGASGFYYSAPPYRLPEFVAGILLAIAWKQGRLTWVKLPVVIVTAAVFALACHYYNGMHANNLTVINIAAVPFFAALIVYAAQSRPAWLEARPLIYLGEISYGFYMFQFIFLAYLFPILRERIHSPYVVAFIGLAVTFCAASASYHFLETPFRALIKTKFRAFRSARWQMEETSPR